MLSKEVEKTLIEWETVNSRPITATFRTTKKVNLNVIQCCTSTNHKDEPETEEFYRKLKSTIDN